jgi:hypothetical protein
MTIANLLDLQSLARVLGGVVVGNQVLAPAPGHSARDRSLSVKLDANAPDGFIVNSFAGDDRSRARTMSVAKPASRPLSLTASASPISTLVKSLQHNLPAPSRTAPSLQPTTIRTRPARYFIRCFATIRKIFVSAGPTVRVAGFGNWMTCVASSIAGPS